MHICMLQFLIRDDMRYREFDEEEAINETDAVDVARGMYNDLDICADEEIKKLLKHIFKYLILRIRICVLWRQLSLFVTVYLVCR